MAMIAEAIEKIVAPLAKPEPFLIAKSQKVFAMMYERMEQIQKTGLLLSDHSLAKISAASSNNISNDKGNIHIQ